MAGSTIKIEDFVDKSKFDVGATFDLQSENVNFMGHVTVNRGDPSVADFTLTTLTTDETWREMDLSSIVPANAQFVILHVNIRDNAAGKRIDFRKKGNVNDKNISRLRTQSANISNSGDFEVPLDSNRKIEYWASNASFLKLNIVVKGWIF